MKRKTGRTTESINEAVNKALAREQRVRRRMTGELRKGTVTGLNWARKRGLTHWHAVGFGCSPTCLKGVGEKLDPEFHTKRSFALYAPKIRRKAS